MSEVLNDLAKSDDPIDGELARALRSYQSILASRGKQRSIGYEPRDIRRYGSIGVIESRVKAQSSGFDLGSASESYEAIVLKYADRFDPSVVEIARARMNVEDEITRPTADLHELEVKVMQLIQRTRLPYPKGRIAPAKIDTVRSEVLRDPLVHAYTLKQAAGRCECCGADAPFKTKYGKGFLEVHHMKRLADGGSDRVQNAVAICPNCHRALHYAENAIEIAERVYARNSRLVRE